MNSGQILSLIIIILFIGSTVGLSFLFNQGGQEGGEETEENLPNIEVGDGLPIETQEIITYRSEEIDANVEEIFPSMSLTATTEEADIIKIDQEIQYLDGITSFQSSYKPIQGQSFSGGLTYIANISFDPSYTRQEILNSIKENTTYLTDIEAYSTALLEIPQTIMLYSVDDKNVFKEHTFDEPYTQGIISFETEAGDPLKVVQQVTFNGEIVIQSIALETANENTAPVQVEKFLGGTIIDLNKKVIFYLKDTYAGTDYNNMKQEIETLNNFDSFESFEVSEPQNPNSFFEQTYSFDVVIDKNLMEADLNELENSLSEISLITSHWVNQVDGETNIMVDFNEGTDYMQLKQDIKGKLNELDFDENEITFYDPMVYIDAEINSLSNETSEIETSLNALFESYDIDESLIYQMSVVDIGVTELTNEDNNITYELESSSFECLINLGHSEQEIIPLDIGFTGIRDKATDLICYEEVV